MTRIDDIDTTGALTKIRFWFIRKLVGRSQVIMNVKIGIVPRNPGVAVPWDGLNCALLQSVTFPAAEPYGMTLQITPRTETVRGRVKP